MLLAANGSNLVAAAPAPAPAAAKKSTPIGAIAGGELQSTILLQAHDSILLVQLAW